ncbi:MAG: phytanoyl-CoA dioxygenase family protein [Pseudomonadota bacterium]
MDTMVRPGTPAYFTPQDQQVTHLELSCDEPTSADDYPLARHIENNIPVYQASSLMPMIDAGRELEIKAELALCLRDGPGVFVICGAYADTATIDVSTALFARIVAEERAAGNAQGDHFGNNERIWNVSQKVCERAPADFLDYYSNPFLAVACEAWLGPCYQLTAQMNTVKPGSVAQAAHRDYHLGFQNRQIVAQFPAHAQMMSQYLTLQGAIAHGDMPLEMGPTMFLPHSQKVPAGYLSFSGDDARAYFAANYVQLPLSKGDMVFFSPALMHGAGTNQTDQDRVANLLQISSAFGRPMETVNRLKMVSAVYPELLRRYRNGMSDIELRHAIAAVADGYSFPTNLDSDPPIGGNAPETAQQMLRRALKNNATPAELEAELYAYAQRQSA